MSLDSQLAALLAKHRANGVLLDTNVLLLLIFAAFMPEKIEGSRRLAKYDEASGRLLFEFVGQFDKIIITQHVLAEVSNLARQNLTGALWNRMAAELYPRFCVLDRSEWEVRDADTTRIEFTWFAKLGLTDSAIVANLGTTFLLTDDLDLYVAALSSQCEAINFTHMREAAGLL